MYKRKRYSSTVKALNRRHFRERYHNHQTLKRSGPTFWSGLYKHNLVQAWSQLLVAYPPSESSTVHVEEMTYDEQCTLRYAKALLSTALKDLVKKKDTCFLCDLNSLISQEKSGCYSEWIDRGGLTYVSQIFLFEKKIRELFHGENIEKLQEEDITRTEVQRQSRRM